MKALFIVAFSILFIACNKEEERLYDVMYRVKGTSRTHKIVFTDKDGKSVTKDSIMDHWEYGFFSKEGAPIALSAQNLDSTGTIIATITINGNVYKTITQSAPYATAAVDGKVEEPPKQ